MIGDRQQGCFVCQSHLEAVRAWMMGNGSCSPRVEYRAQSQRPNPGLDTNTDTGSKAPLLLHAGDAG